MKTLLCVFCRCCLWTTCLIWVAQPMPAKTLAPSEGAKPDLLRGVWGTEANFGPYVRGDLIIDGRDGQWRALLAGYQVAAKEERGEVRFKLPGDEGGFRGHLDPATKTIRGEWIQPPGAILNNRYASPVDLLPLAPSVWRGSVVPLDQRFSVYASINLSSDGRLSAFISNPETNFFRRRTFDVSVEGTTVRLSTNGEEIDGAYDQESDTLSLRLVDFMPLFRFSRRSDGDAVGFYPRVGLATEGYQYHKPIPDNDGWTISSLSEVGLDEGPIGLLIDRILKADLSNNPVYIHSLLVSRHGRLALEEYFYGNGRERVHDMRSASKTFASVLAGIADEHGAKLTPSTPVYSLFSNYGSFANPDPRKQKITLRDIMTMSAGNACDDSEDQSPGNEDRMQQQSAQPDWYKYTLDLPMARDPGGPDALYCSADINLVGGAVARAMNAWLPDLFERYIARPLQFGHYYLNLMPDGQAYMGGGAYLRPRDQIKLGQLYLDHGIWNGRRIVSEKWVAESTSMHTRFSAENSLGQEHQYGYGWHIRNVEVGGKSYRLFAAEGNGGQFIIVIPDLDLVVGITGGSYGEFKKWYAWELELIPQYIIPAAVHSGPM